MAKIKRILLECTHTYESSLNTGIQRVVRNIVRESEQISRELNVECKPVIFKNGRFFAVNYKKRFLVCLRAYLWAFLRTKTRKLQSILRPVPIGRMRLVSIINFFFDILFFPVILYMHITCKISIGKGDILLLLDSSWVYPIWPAVKQAKNNGAVVGVVLYDLIPLKCPQFFVSGLINCFKNWFSQAVKVSDFYVAISRTVCNEARDYITSKNSSISYEMFEWFRLGSVLDKVKSKGTVREDLKDLFKKRNTYFAVGTIEPRKNYNYLLDTFELVWQRNQDVNLCIVGRIGWSCQELVSRIKSHNLFKKNLYMFNNVSDTELDYCYNHAKALIFPSYVEGFGLPIVEALYHNLPVLASDVAVHREIGKNFCTYFDISDPANLAKIIMNIEKTGKMPEVRNPEDYDLPTWKDSCRELLSKAVALYEKVVTQTGPC